MKKNTMSRNIILIIIIAIVISIVYFFMNGNNSYNYNSEKVKFNAAVLENKGTSLLVRPDENEDELKSSDKIVVRIPQDGAVLKDLSEFTVGSKVEITYDGKIMESYPAQINAYEVKLFDSGNIKDETNKQYENEWKLVGIIHNQWTI